MEINLQKIYPLTQLIAHSFGLIQHTVPSTAFKWKQKWATQLKILGLKWFILWAKTFHEGWLLILAQGMPFYFKTWTLFKTDLNYYFFFKVALKLFILFFQTFQTIDLFLLVNLFTYVIDSLLYSLYCLYFCHNCVKLLNAILILELFVLSINLFQIEWCTGVTGI